VTRSDGDTTIGGAAGQAHSSAAGFYSDISPKGRRFRLSVDSTADGWSASVVDLDSKAHIKKDIWAATAAAAKTLTAEFMRSVVHYIGPIDWRPK
jgi:hypothetical protein